MNAAETAMEGEVPIVFRCAGEHLIGVVHRPSAHGARAGLGVVIVVGGPQYRAGSHRQFVQWARAFAAAGYPSLRFDTRGMGDSSGAARKFTEVSDDIGAAVDTLFEAGCGVERVVLCGLCDGASAALLYLDERRDARVAGAILLNPWVRSLQTQARTAVRHYYAQRLRQRAFWSKLLGGGVASSAGGELLAALWRAVGRAAAEPSFDVSGPFQERMLRGIERWGGPMLLALSGEDYTAKEFVELCASDRRWQSILARPTVERVDFEGADHTFSSAEDRLALEATSIRWLHALAS